MNIGLKLLQDVAVYCCILISYIYRIALIFCGSKFSQIAALKKFIEKILQICIAYVCYSAVSQILVE